MHFTTATLALAASALAFPAIIKKDADDNTLTPAPLCERFAVAFEVDGSYVSANAVKNGTEILLQAQRPSVYPGTQAYLNYSTPQPDQNGFNYTALNFVIDEEVYGAAAGDVGDNYGLSEDIFLTKNYQQFEWLVNNGSINHKLYAAPNSLYACNGTLATGEEGVFLAFGDYDFGPPVAGPPKGCAFTKVIQNFNVEGGLRPDD